MTGVEVCDRPTCTVSRDGSLWEWNAVAADRESVADGLIVAGGLVVAGKGEARSR